MSDFVPRLHYSSLVMGRIIKSYGEFMWQHMVFLFTAILNNFCKVLTLKLTTKELFMQVAVTVYIKEKYVLLKSDI